MKTLGRIALVVLMGASTYYTILRVAEHKADALAGGGTFRLDRAHRQDQQAFEALLGRLRQWDQPDLARSLLALQEEGRLFVAPHLAGERSAIYVDSLGLVRRIYVRPDELVARKLPFPDLDAPEAAQRTFTRIRLAGTLFHELQHYGGLEDEGETYDREIEWYRRLREVVLPGLDGDPARWFAWAVDSALESARAAREKATGASASEGRNDPTPDLGGRWRWSGSGSRRATGRPRPRRGRGESGTTAPLLGLRLLPLEVANEGVTSV